MDALEILEKYSGEDHTPRYLLDDGGVIIGLEPDEGNHMVYVVKRGDEVTLEPSSDLKVVKDLIKHEGEVIIHNVNQ